MVAHGCLLIRAAEFDRVEKLRYGCFGSIGSIHTFDRAPHHHYYITILKSPEFALNVVVPLL